MKIEGYDRIVTCDTEFTPGAGDLIKPICLVAHELMSGERVRLWRDELRPDPPFPMDDRTLYVCFVAQAEIGFFLACGWPAPSRVLDLHAEFRNHTNKALPKHHEDTVSASLLDALDYFRIREVHGYTASEKKRLQDICIAGGPEVELHRAEILDYCEADVEVLAPLLERMEVHIRSRRKAPGAPRRGLVQALHRGRYTAAVANMEARGTPIDMETLGWILEHRAEVQEHLIAEGDRDYGVYEGTTFKDPLFRKYLKRQGLLDLWPRTGKRGYLCTDKDTMEEQAKSHPQLAKLQQMMALERTLGDFKLEVGSDGRNRTSLWPFTTATGRNAPSNAKFIFGASAWWRGLVKPEEGRAIAYVDYSAQEVGIAAALSGDLELLKAVESSDPYLSFAVRAGLAPDGATKATHPEIRKVCKIAVLGMNYGLGVRSLAAGTGLTVPEAEALHRQMRKVYDIFQIWTHGVIDTGLLRRELSTYFGWRVRVVDGTKTTTLQNFPAQSHGAEMLRLACCLIVEDGIQLCCPIHDAVLVEAADDEIDDVVARTRAHMAAASRVVLDGFEVGTDAEIIRWPDRYMDKERGEEMWNMMVRLKDGR